MKRRLIAALIAVTALVSSSALAGFNPEVRYVDIDVDADYNGIINDADDSIEMSTGGVVCVGGWTNIILQQTLVQTQPGDENKVQLSWSNTNVLVSDTLGGSAITPDGTVGANIVYKDYFPSELPKTLWVKGVHPSIAKCAEHFRLEALHYDAPYDPDTFDDIAITVLKMSLREVHFRGFTGASGTPLKDHDYAETPIDPPEWLDANLDGDTDDPGDKNEPGAFKKDEKFKVKAIFDVQGIDPTQVQVWAEGGILGGLNSASTPVTLDSASAGIFEINTPSTTVKYDENGTWQWNWKCKVAGTTMACDIGTSSHTICITHGDPVSTPVFKWVMIPSCKSCNGLGTTVKVAADATFLQFESNAKVGTDVLRYDPKAAELLGDDGSVKFLLKNKIASCHAWANYFNDLVRGQGFNDCKVRAFSPVKKVFPDTNFNGEQKWTGFVTTKNGMNNAQPGMVLNNFRVPNVGKYAQTGGGTAEADTAVIANEKVWAVLDHVLVMLQDGADTWVYDTSFGNGTPIKLANFAVPANGVVGQYGAADVFMTGYFNTIYKYVEGNILIKPLWLNYLDLCYVRPSDLTLAGAKPNKFFLNWIAAP